jgi:adenylate cyclase
MINVPSDCVAWLEDSGGRQFPIRGSCALGRSVSNQVALTDEKVSRRHALIQAQRENEFWLVDFGSRNGTYLNSRRITQPTRLQPGDRLQIGSSQFVFQQQTRASLPVACSTVYADQTVADIRPVKCWLLVADIVDSTRLVRELPPDELPLVTGQWVAECKQVIEGQGGRINQFMGDGFFAYWHDRERAEVAINQALQDLRRLQDQARPSFRLVVHLGSVTLGGVSVGEEERISGSAVHFVFRMEKLAGRLGEIRLISDEAWQRLAALVQAREVGFHALPGFENPVPFHAF